MSDRFDRRTVLRGLGVLGASEITTAGATGSAAAAETGADAADADASEEPTYPSPAWYDRERWNYGKTREAPKEQQTPTFQERLQRQSLINTREYQRRRVEEPGWRSDGNLGTEWAETAAGDPFRYPSVDPFYGEAGERTRVAFYDHGGARLSGRVWVPADSADGDSLPAVVITCGSVQATEPMYWWFARTLVENGYAVMTYDVRGQGRSDTTTPDGEPGSNLHPEVFVTNQVAAIDFLHSTPDEPYPLNERYGDPDSPAPVLAHNPYHDRIDPDRLGVAGHSAGAVGVSVVQGLEPWPGAIDDENPVDAVVAWDNLGNADQMQQGGGEVEDVVSRPIVQGDYSVEPRVPAMGQSGDYFLAPTPKESPPDPAAKRQGYDRWSEAGIPAYQLVIRGGTHYEWSLGGPLPATSWRPPEDQEGGVEPGGFGNVLADHYSLAWLDRWLKESGEPGYDDADARLLADDEWADRLSFYYESARDFPDRSGTRHVCEDVRDGC